MNLYTTEIKAINPATGYIVLWSGPNIPGISFADAEDYCQKNGLGYCKVTGVLYSEIPANDDLSPDWSKEVVFHNLN